MIRSGSGRGTSVLLQGHPHHPSLRLHALAGKFEGLHSISINLSYRITIDFIIRERQIVPINIGDHETTHR
jgi:plasmid maintenance system killer protein